MQTLKKGNPNKTIAAKKKQAIAQAKLDEIAAKENLEFINNLDPRLAKTFLAIEADSYAYRMIWKEYKDKYTFVQDSSGLAREIGRIGKRPIMLEFSWWEVNGHRVLFYSCCSQLVDWKMIEDWLKKYMPHLKHTSDASNAHNVLRECAKEEVLVSQKQIKCYTCMDSKQVEARRIGYDSIMCKCPNC